MLRTRPECTSPITCLLALASVFFATSAHGQMSVDEVIVTSGPAYQNGVFTDFFIDPVVFGSELAAVSVTLSGGETIDFVEVLEDEFVCDEAIVTEPCEGFTSLAEINAIGDLTFNVLGESGETDTWVVAAADYAPGAGQVGLPMITSPSPSQSVFVPGAAFVWSVAPAWVDAIQTDLVDVLLDDGVDEMLFLGNTQTSWTPANAVAGRDYDFEISFVELFFFGDSRTTVGGLPFEFTSGYQAFNRKFVPEPTTASALFFGTLALVGIGRFEHTRRGRA